MNNCEFIGNNANSGGGLFWHLYANNNILIGSTFTDNTAAFGAGVYWMGNNGILSGSNFNNNAANSGGGGVYCIGNNISLINSIFSNNHAIYNGGAVYWAVEGSLINCYFVNNKWINNNGKTNGIYAAKNLNINGGEGIVDIVPNETLSGISIVVLNNETYYYPPNTNINFTKKNIKQDMIE